MYARKKKTEDSFTRAKKLRNECNRVIYNAKCEYITEQLEKHKNDQKTFWECIKNVMPTKDVTIRVREVVSPLTGELCNEKD